MRTGLVGLGAVGVVLGVSLVLIALWNLPPPGTSTTATRSTYTVVNGRGYTVVLSPPSGATSFVVSYSSDQPITALLSTCSNAPTQCSIGNASFTRSGSWTVSHPSSPLYLSLSDEAVQAATVLVATDASVKSTGGFVWWEEIIVLFAGGVLMAAGGMGVFLGLFLQGNPYARGLPPLPPPEEGEGASGETPEGAPGGPDGPPEHDEP